MTWVALLDDTVRIGESYPLTCISKAANLLIRK